VVGLYERNLMVKYRGVIWKCSACKFKYSVSHACWVAVCICISTSS